MSETSAAAKNPALEDAVLRAQEIASKIKTQEGSSLKRPLEFDSDHQGGPDSKRFGNEFNPRSRPGMMQGGVSDMAEGMATETITVPSKMVGLIIGRGGEQIMRLQSESGCKIQMAQDNAGHPERQCTLTGQPAAIAAAKAAIEHIIANEGNGPHRGPPGQHQPHHGGAGGAGFFEMMVAGHKVGLVIGKGGETIRHLQESTGAKIVVIQESAEFDTEKPLRITGPPDSVERARAMVSEILNQNDDRDMGFGGRGRGRGRGGFMGGRGRGGGGRGGFGGDRGPGHWGGPVNDYGGQHEDYVSVPASKCGLVIGKGGETIKNINQTTGAHCTVDKNAPPDAQEKNFIIRGTPEAVERAKAMILEKLGMQDTGYGGGKPAGGYGGGAAAASWGGAVAVAPQAGQADYSAQWVEYYRSMGMTREAEAIEQAARSAAPVQPAAQPMAAAAAANGAPDYSAQWAEYYRSQGKIKEAEEIEAQMKQKAQFAQPAGYYGGAQPQPAAAYAGYGYAG